MRKPASPPQTQNTVYVIQIAARDPQESHELTGLIEDIGAGKITHFSTVADLVCLLSGEANAKKSKKQWRL